MANQQLFFYLKDINPLIEEATKAGGFDLGIVITPSDKEGDKPVLQVSYLTKTVQTELTEEEQLTDPVDGCPYPPRCS